MDKVARSHRERPVCLLRDAGSGCWPGMLKDICSSEICTLIFIWQVFSPASVVFAGIGVLLSVCIFNTWIGHRNTYISQAAKDVRASQATLMDIFGRIESFFRRLEIYTEVPQTVEMMDTIILIMVEVLSILGVATKEIRQGRMSE